MGEIADDCYDRAMDELYERDQFSPFTGRQPKGRKGKRPPANYYNQQKRGFDDQGKIVKHQGKPKTRPGKMSDETRAIEYPGKETPAHLLRDYPKETFDMGFFKVAKPRSDIEKAFDVSEDDAPF